MLILATAAFLVFWLRDYMALRMSPTGRTIRRAAIYAVGVLLTATSISVAETMAGAMRFNRLIQSPPILFLLVGFHLAAGLSTLWLKRTERYNLMWATALLPAPIVWFFLLETAIVSDDRGHHGLFALAAIWATSMVVVTFRTRQAQMPLEDLDFAVRFGGLSHCFAVCILPLAFSTM